jgi:hypothetical protein
MNNNNVQMRGHCQICGRIQAVNSGIAKHGYTKEFGYFHGVCNGSHSPAMEVDTSVTAAACAEWRARADRMEAEGFKVPAMVKPEYPRNAEPVPFESLSVYRQEQVRKLAEYNHSREIKFYREHAAAMEALAASVHGEPLVEVVKATAAPRIEAGERRMSESGNVLTACYQDGARVYFTREGRTFKGWIGSKAWRNLSPA